ncbi:SWIM zinc finger family protein [Streptomyces sp. NPDC093250]|uniref:SWIM zinc finger family protein n=1 Tax=Streptomyces sp. NPDC093250 TaxID=3366036 RepID=UPI0037F2CDA2
MTPRPSDEAREALRAARARATSEARDHPAPADRQSADQPHRPAPADRQSADHPHRPGDADRQSADQPHRPGDAAREALRRAVRARRAASAAPGEEPTSAARNGLSGPSDRRPLPQVAGTDEESPSGAAHQEEQHQPHDGAPRTEPPAGLAPVAATAPDDDTGTARRPGDVAREALRSARAKAERARTTAEDDRHGQTGSERRRGTPRVPRTTRGDRAAAERARQVRAALTEAFQMPADTDDPHREPPAHADDPGRVPSADADDPGRVLLAGTDDPRRVPLADTVDPRRVPSADADGPRREPTAHAVDPRRVPSAGTDDPRRKLPADADDPRREPPADADGPHGELPADEGPRQDAPAAPSGAPARGRGTAAGLVPPSASHTPHAAPRSMAAPARDGDLRRTFPAFPPRASEGEDFAGTWWGRAWVTALEGGALDPARLARGRGYAEQGHVDAITVTPGLVLAYVRGSRPRPYRVQVRLRTFEDADWERFLDAAADRPGHIAALLDGEMPRSLADCGVPLLPAPGDLAPRCSCPDSGHPCKHAAALCYQTARLLDADPFVLLLLRGRGEREVIDALSRLSAARAARAAQEREPEPLPGVRASDAFARRGQLPPLPAPLPPPPHPEQPPVYPASPGGPDPFALDQLATDAAARAHALLTTGRDPVGGLTLWHDAVRLAAARPGSGLTAATRALYSSLARAAGRTPAELARAVAAWRQGGPAGLAVLEEPWDPPAGRFDRARPLLLAADLPAFRPWRNHLTHPRGHVQLRLGRDHLWYAYESEPGHDDWWPRGTPDPDPVGALTGLDSPDAF